MSIKKGLKTILALSLCFIMATAFMSCGGKTQIESISIQPTNINVVVNTVIQFQATGSQSNGLIGNVNTQVSWSSSNPSVATVSSSGLVTAVGAGTVTITAGTSGNIKAPATLTVSPIPIPISIPVGNKPSAIAIDSSGNLWVTNQGDNSITELSSSGTVINTFSNVVGPDPSGIAIDDVGNIWVTNMGTAAVPGTTVTELNSSGTVIGNFTVGSNPSSIFIDPFSDIWVTNQGSNSVTLLFSTGTLYATYTAGIGAAPTGLAIGSEASNWVTWVANMGTAAAPGNSITALFDTGTVYGTFTVGIGNGPSSIAIDPYNNVWVTNSASNNITELNANGALIGTFTPAGINGPHALSIDTAGSVWVTNYGTTTVPGTTIMELGNTNGGLLNAFTVGNNPSAIAIDSLNNVWVTNYGSNSVTLLKGIATGPQFRTYTTGPIWP